MRPKYDFSYLVDKIMGAEFCEEPFKHIYLEKLFTPEHFDEILASREISGPTAKNDLELIKGLRANGFKPISFPGCVTDVDEYIKWHGGGKVGNHHSACEGFGMVLRLYEFHSPILEELNQFLASREFNDAIAQKFGVDPEVCIIDGGIQKYLDGYEISPHPDIRKKAATFMVNINPSDKSEGMDHHTHYLKFDDAHKYVESFWQGNKCVDRAWVPWDWAVTVKQQTKNNSIVLFSPSDDTLHGVKADYDHLVTQRTQLYGNLWYRENLTTSKSEWEDLDLSGRAAPSRKPASPPLTNRMKQAVSSVMLPAIKRKLKSLMVRDAGHDVGKRNI